MTFLAPVQQAGNALSVEVANIEDKLSVFDWIGLAWPVFLRCRLGMRVAGQEADRWHDRSAGRFSRWAALRWPNGAARSLSCLTAFFVLARRACPRCAGSGNCRASRTRVRHRRPPMAPQRRPRRCCSRSRLPDWRDFGASASSSGHRRVAAEGTAGGRIRHAADSRRGQVRLRDGEDSLAGGERPAPAALVRAGGAHANQLSRRMR